jgi:hypothetical protein
VAIFWKTTLDKPVPSKWKTVATRLAPPPIVDGLYAVYEGLDSSWWNDISLTDDPRSLIMLQGILPDTPAVDFEIAKRTADKIDEIWKDEDVRGWGRVVLSINSARIGERERAIRHLTSERWVFDDAGMASYNFVAVIREGELIVGIGFAVRGGDGWFYLLPELVGTQTVTNLMA